MSTKIGATLLNNSAKSYEIRKAWGEGDAGSLLDVALTWSNLEQLNEETQYWIVRSWSPGMALLETPLIWLEKLIPIFWSLLAVSITLWVSIFYLYWKKFVGIPERVLLLIVFIGMLMSWDFKYMFVDYLFYTETLAFGCLFLGMSIMSFDIVLNSEKSSKKKILLTASLIGFSVWIRHTSETGLFLLFLLSLFLVRYLYKSYWNINSVSNYRNRRKNQKLRKKIKEEAINNAKFKFHLKNILVVSLIAIVITVPWRMIGMVVYGNPAPVMSGAAGIVGPGVWALPESERAKYWGSYGQNWACKIDFNKCKTNQIQKASPSKQLTEAIKTALLNPLDYTKERLKYFFFRWIPGFNSGLSIYGFIALVELLIPFASLTFFFKIKSKNKYLLMIIWCSFLVMHSAQLLLIHFESRYFIPIRILNIGLLLNLFALYRMEGKKRTLLKR